MDIKAVITFVFVLTLYFVSDVSNSELLAYPNDVFPPLPYSDSGRKAKVGTVYSDPFVSVSWSSANNNQATSYKINLITRNIL